MTAAPIKDSVKPRGSQELKFVIITPAHNEEELIEKTIRSVLAQTVLPLRWVIINDGSTDGTENVIARYALHYDFIKAVNVRRTNVRSFARKALAFELGLETVAEVDYDIIGNLDADITLEREYFENVLKGFEVDPLLGITGGTVYIKVGNAFVTQDKTLDSVGGAVQLFRRTCFEEIGGYLPLEAGGIDAAAEIIARMRGWKVRKSLENHAYEHPRTRIPKGESLRTKVREGRRFYSLGYSTSFYFLRCIYRVMSRPKIIGSAAALMGFLNSMARREPIALPKDVVGYLRNEQKQKLTQIMLRLWNRRPADFEDRTS